MLLLAPVIALAAIAAAALVLYAQRAGQARLVGRVVEPGAQIGAAAAPALLYFTGEACTVCHTAQTPALQRLATMLDEPVRVREIDVAREPDIARRYRVLSLPTTVVLDGGGHVVAVNVGYAPAERLRQQLMEARREVAA